MKKIVMFVIIVLLLITIGIILLIKNGSMDNNILYSVKFNDEIIRIIRYDYAIGQNQIVGVEKKDNNSKNYNRLTDNLITVSMEPKFVFLNSNLGFIISKTNLMKSNNYIGIKVTNDGGKTFDDCVINYDNHNVEIITIEDVPYQENNQLKLNCSIYQINKDKTGYETVKLIFESDDNGLSWNLLEKKENQEKNIMIIEVNNKDLIVELEDNSSSRALLEKLKEGNISILANDYGNFEKVGELGFTIPQNNQEIETRPGDVILYQGSNICLYYDINTWNFTKLGRVINVSGDELKELLGVGSVNLTLKAK